MPIIEILFYLFSGVLVLSALSVITVGNPIHAALFLILSFFSAACIWMLLQAEFLAITLVLVYVGAVMVLFLFVVMMLDVHVASVREGFARYLPAGVLVALAMAVQLFLVIWTRGMETMPMPAGEGDEYSHTSMIGELLYSEYLYAFEIAAVVLLVAIIAAIALTHRRRPETKHQDPARQVRVKRDERLRVVKMKSEGEEA
ncbi:MAG: NADH-quinone oxidoreductase subunit J [Gammaproteobacteria bacterium]|jgi:NADH-quinone oxidoreductase subunit J|nr:NADH-quinone oxidoreductase subunit J [Gammaproteobacteria bacterium]